MTDLVERLRRKALYGIGSGEFYNDILNEAAARVEALEAALRNVRQQVADVLSDLDIALSPEPEGTVEEPPRDNSITDAW